MSRNYDNWEKLVGAVLKRELFRKLALCHSMSSDDNNGASSCFSSRFDRHHHQLVVCKGQKPHTDSFDFDASIWERFLLPQDHNPQMIGKVVFLPVEAKEFTILTDQDSPKHILQYDRNGEAVEVKSVMSLDIRGKIRTRLLTSRTIYGVYLVFKLDYISMGLKRAKAVIRFVDDETDVEALRRGGIVHLHPDESEREGISAVCRGDDDEWIEVEIGSFYVDGGDEGEVEARVVETSNHRKGGLIIEGIEFRPLLNVKYTTIN